VGEAGTISTPLRSAREFDSSSGGWFGGDVAGGKAWVAFGYDGEPLEPAHGAPAWLLVPHLSGWKSAKWSGGPGFSRTTSPASARSDGYHMYATPGASSNTRATSALSPPKTRLYGTLY
jgi:DMSO/TMAO reductase YedYZ molybdopterin-dependent catalytic subunit